VGLEYVEYAVRASAKSGRTRSVPWFAIGGLDETTVGPVLEAGARRIVVVRAITEAQDPEAAARSMRAALEKAPVGT
jgi:thiamine-phosphate pyrophosphorylase